MFILDFKYLTKWKLIVLLQLLSLSLCAQLSNSNQVLIEGQIIQQLQGTVAAIPNAPLKFKGFGVADSDAKGKFFIQLPAVSKDKDNCIILVDLALEGFEIISPFDGKLSLDQGDATACANVKIIALKKEEKKNEYYSAQLYSLRKRLNKLQVENNLSVNRVNAINDSLIQNINIYLLQKSEMNQKINSLNEDLAKASSDNTELRQNLQRKISDLENAERKEQDLRDKLLEALEAKYLRQQKYFKTISIDLNDYLIRAKDVLEQVQHVKEYFPQSNNPDYVTTYNNTLKNYNTVLVKINEQHKDYLENVDHYWSSPEVTEQLAATFDVLFEQLHYPKLQPCLSEINKFIRTNKRKKADQFGQETFKELYPIILNLEKSIEKSMNLLDLKL